MYDSLVPGKPAEVAGMVPRRAYVDRQGEANLLGRAFSGIGSRSIAL